MTGKEYADLIAAYIVKNFAGRSVVVYREVSFGRSIIGKNRCVDVFVHVAKQQSALVVECKFQAVQGTTDEKIPYALDDLAALRMPACMVYAGEGWSSGVRHMLAGSPYAAYCLPDPKTLARTDSTRELDQILSQQFAWWDLLVDRKKPFELAAWKKG